MRWFDAVATGRAATSHARLRVHGFLVDAGLRSAGCRMAARRSTPLRRSGRGREARLVSERELGGSGCVFSRPCRLCWCIRPGEAGSSTDARSRHPCPIRRPCWLQTRSALPRSSYPKGQALAPRMMSALPATHAWMACASPVSVAGPSGSTKNGARSRSTPRIRGFAA